MNLMNMLKGPLIVGVAVTLVSMALGPQLAQWFGSWVAGGTAAVAVLVLDFAKVKY